MRLTIHSVALLLFGLTWNLAKAEETAYIPIGSARTKKSVIAFPDIRASGQQSVAVAKAVQDIVARDLAFMDIFQFLGPSAFIEDVSKSGIEPGSFKFPDWSAIGAEVLVKASLIADRGNLILEAHVYNVPLAKQLLNKKYLGETRELRNLAHTFSNNIVETLTGLPGIFLTKIAASCERAGKKEIYTMNYDGSETRQVSHHRSIAFAPAWSPDGTRIAYSLITKHRNNVKNIDLFEYDFNTGAFHLLSNRRGINSGAAYSPNGQKIALTLSFDGNPEIFSLDPASKTAVRLTKSFGFDVDPSWSPDGKKLAFVSSRSGVPMVFSMNADGSNIQRLTFAGRYNATPTWSPQNNKIGFAGWIDQHFDIFIMNPDGTNIERLTKNQGNNEDPHFSPDGNFLVFSSTRAEQKNIYVMNVDGTFVRRLTYGLGNCTSPKWSNTPRSPLEIKIDQR